MTDEPNAKESLPIRQNLVVTAVGFLLNPNVKERPDDAKIAFLKQKGLTDSEIDAAFNKVKYEASIAPNENSQLVNAYPLPPYQTPYPFWFYLRSYSSTFVSFAVAVYVLHRFYKSYIEPWLFGSKSEQSEISALMQQITELNNSVSRLTLTVASLEEAVTNQIHIDRTSLYGVESFPKSVKDIQEELSHVKSILVNRFSFPALPSSAGSSVENKTQGKTKAAVKVVTIPKWQMSDSEHGTSKVDSKEQLNESENKEQTSTEPSSLENGLSSTGDRTQDLENEIKNEDSNESEEKKQSSAEALSLEKGLSSIGDQTQDLESDLKIANCKEQEDSKAVSEDKNENSSECLKNNLIAKGKNQNKDAKAVVGNQVRNIDEKTLGEDSGFESHNLPVSESTDLINERSVSAKKSK